MKKVIYTLTLTIAFFVTSCFSDPVHEDYFFDLSKIKGGNKPDSPVIVSLESCENSVTINFTGSDGDVDVDGDSLIYVICYSADNPENFSDDKEYYNPLRVVAAVNSADPVELYSRNGGTFYFWLTAYDGGRESDHSNVLSITVSAAACL